MASTCTITKGMIQLGTGSCEDGSASITSYSGTAPSDLRNVTVTVTQSGTHAGRSWNSKVASGSGTSTLTLVNTCPFVGA